MTVDRSLIDRVCDEFHQKIGGRPGHLIQAPGRVNLIGEHTDYNDGFVLPCAINFHTLVAARIRGDNKVRVIALDFDSQEDVFDLGEAIKYREDLSWANYVRGVVKCIQDKGYEISGADLVVSGNVPQGAGLSSSASLEVAIGETFNRLFGLNIVPQEIALIGQQAENKFVGCNCGIMDQLISAKGEEGQAVLIDCRSLGTQPTRLPSGLSVLIVNSNKKRELVDSAYNERREQCEQAASFFKVKALRDLDMATFEAGRHGLSDTVMRRARHVVSENERTLAAADALMAGDMNSIQNLMAQSHASMRDDFEITVGEIDYLVDLIKSVVGEQGGVRMTGGGFGGCVVALIPDEMVDPVIWAIMEKYPVATGLKPDIFTCSASMGTGPLELREVS